VLQEVIDHIGLNPADQFIPNQYIWTRFAVFAAQASPNFHLGVKFVLAEKTFYNFSIEVISARKA